MARNETITVRPCIECSDNMTCVNSQRKFCSNKCRRTWSKWNRIPNVACGLCKTPFWVKNSQIAGVGKMVDVSNFCSEKCQMDGRKISVCLLKEKLDKEPNYARGKYPSGSHKRVAIEVIGLERIPRGYHVHHRDTDKQNNSPENLVLLTIQDHFWLHHELGNAVLRGYSKGIISLDTIAEKWTSDPARVRKLLPLKVTLQHRDDFLVADPKYHD